MLQGSFPRQVTVSHISSSGYGNSVNSRQGKRGTPRLYILDMRKTQFVELTNIRSLVWEIIYHTYSHNIIIPYLLSCRLKRIKNAVILYMLPQYYYNWKDFV